MSDTQFFDKWPSAVRWICVPIATALGYLAACFIVAIVISSLGHSDFSLLQFGRLTKSPWAEIKDLAVMAFGPYTAISAGVRMAPSGKVPTATVIATLFSIGAGAILVLAILLFSEMKTDWSFWSGTVSMLIGVGSVWYAVKTQWDLRDNERLSAQGIG